MILLLLFACGGKSPDSAASLGDTAVADTSSGGGDTSSGGVDTSVPDAELYGERPVAPVSLPAFAATNRDGTARGSADLRGGATVMWFYPAAGTYG
jgi:hypothetical protein